MWLFFALMAPLFFGFVHVIDSYCVEDIFDEPWMGMITSALASIVLILALPYLLPFFNWDWPSWKIIFMAIVAGCLIQYSQGLYFQALAYSEAGIVAAYWNLVPAMVPLFSFILLNERLSINKYIGILILVIASSAFCLIDSNLKSRRKTLVFMSVASLMQAVMLLMSDIIFDKSDYFEGFILITLGIVISGLSPLFFKKTRKIFLNNSNALIFNAKFFVSIEIINLLALAFSQRAIDLGSPSLVAAIESTIPAYTFIILIISTYVLPKFGDPKARTKLSEKFALICLMVFGVFLVA